MSKEVMSNEEMSKEEVSKKEMSQKEISPKKETGAYTICENKGIGNVQVADEVVCIVAALAATEVEGVECMSGNITNELVSKLGMKALSKGVTVNITEKTAVVFISVILKYGYSVPEVSARIQERVTSAIETMTGLTVAEVNVKIAGVKIENR